MSKSLKRFKRFLHDSGMDCVVQELPQGTRSAAEAARAVGCDIAQIAKTIVFKNETTDSPVVIVASGQHEIDTHAFTAHTGIRLARADGRYVREQLGYAIGGVPPAGHVQPCPVYLDRALQQHANVWAAAGTPNAIFELTPASLAELTRGTWIDVR